jgi:pseudouridine-5'-phosphate glycosidase
MVVGIAVLATNGVAGVWGAVAWLRKDPSVWFWYLLRVAQASVVIQALIGFGLLAQGMRAPDSLHAVYGFAPLAITLFSEGMRVGVAQRELEDVDIDGIERAERIVIARKVALAEMGVMTIGVLMILTLALRAYQTGS